MNSFLTILLRCCSNIATHGAEFPTLLVQISLLKVGHTEPTPEHLDQEVLLNYFLFLLIDSLSSVTEYNTQK